MPNAQPILQGYLTSALNSSPSTLSTMSTGKNHIYIGTSGWSYKEWVKTFYPTHCPVRHHFDFYSTQFPTVEINLTFYRLPDPSMVKGWAEKAPQGFLYAVKGSRFITHMKKLANVEEALDKYFERIQPLRSRIVCVLWQLPPNLSMDLPRLDRFLSSLPAGYAYAVEFRHRSWMDAATFKLLRRHGVAFTSVSSLAMPICFETTSNLVYIRFHGLEGGAAHDYTVKEMEPWADHVRYQAAKGKTVLVYFNNDRNVCAPANAKKFMKMTGAAPAFKTDAGQGELLAA